ncbi:MAG: hypothetical protein KGI54_15025 [Pseudomonadota bacterium]|nr:hypothetical protein [Pseudomonadota bacterium]
MNPGSLFVDRHFKFNDGAEAQKILIVLGNYNGVTLVVKTTSNGRLFLNDFGCQVTHRFPNFYLPKSCCCLEKPTWVVLNEFYEFKHRELLQRHFDCDIWHIGTLPPILLMELMNCSVQAEDISFSQIEMIKSSLKEIESEP